MNRAVSAYFLGAALAWTASAWTPPPTTPSYNVSAYPEPPVDWCFLQQEVYWSFNQIVGLWSNTTAVDTVWLVDSDRHTQSAVGLPAIVTLFAIGAVLLAMPMLVGSTATLNIAVWAVAAMMGALAAVIWLMQGSDQMNWDGEGTLEHRRGAHPADSGMYSIGVIGLGAACFGIVASQVVEIGVFFIGAGTGGYCAYLLQQHLSASSLSHPAVEALAGRSPVAISAAAFGCCVPLSVQRWRWRC
jgi:hypothetical protein